MHSVLLERPSQTDACAGEAEGRQRVMLLSPWYPQPVDNGSKQRLRLMIDALCTEYEVLLVCLLAEDEHAGGGAAAVPGVARTWVLPYAPFQSRSVRGIGGAISGTPRSIAATWDRDVSKRISAIVRDYGVAAVIGHDMKTFRYLDALPPNVATVLDEPNVSPFTEGDGLRARLRRWNYSHLLRRHEQRISAVMTASEAEAAAYTQLAGRMQVELLVNSIDIAACRLWSPPAGHQALYTGSLTYAPNAEAVAFWVRQIQPLVARSMPDVTLTVTGVLPPILPAEAEHAAVRLTGRVADLEPHFAEARVFVAPIQSGTGTRIKLLEAMAHGMPIVTTTKGIEGIQAQNNEHLLIADDPRDFAACVVRLFLDPQLSLRLGTAAREYVEAHHSATAAGSRLREIVQGTLTHDTSPAGRR